MDYNFQANTVDMKADNTHASARVMDTLANDDLKTDKLQISAGAVVIVGSTAGRIDVATTGSQGIVGIATQTRQAGDSRDLTYTRKGLVHAIKDAAALVAGDRVIPSTYGRVKAAATDGSDSVLEFGKCIVGSAAVVGGEVVVIELTL